MRRVAARGLLGLAVTLATVATPWLGPPRAGWAASTEIASVAPDGSPIEAFFPAISADGRFVAFGSTGRVWVRDRLTRTTRAVHDTPRLVTGLAISADGRFVVFTTFGAGSDPLCAMPVGSDTGMFETNAFVHDLDTGLTTPLAKVCDTVSTSNDWLSISRDGRFVLTPLTPGVIDRATGQIIVTALRESLSADGSVVVGRTSGSAPHTIRVLVQNLLTGLVEPVIEESGSVGPERLRLSADGGAFSYTDIFQKLQPPGGRETGIFVRDRRSGSPELISVGRDGAEPNGTSCRSTISDGGQYVTFLSSATNLADGPPGGEADVFVRDRLTRVTQRVNVDDRGVPIPYRPSQFGCFRGSGPPVISADGRYVAFEIERVVYVRDRGPTVTSFLTDLYRYALGRPPEPAGLEAAEASIAGRCGDAELAAAATRIFDSPEFRARPLTPAGLVAALYRSLLERDPEPAGLAHYAALLRRQRVELAARFVASPEFASLLADRQDPAAVREAIVRLYTHLLGRTPADFEVSAWVGYVTASGDVEGAVAAFVGSPEFETRALTFADYVEILYRALLARDPEPGAVGFWEGVLRAHLVDIVVGSFIPSPEFQGRGRDICGG